ncbi:MAG: pseudouridine synthase [Patescibacteria group bacterium]
MEDKTIRLNKYLANLGVCARRDVEQLLKQQTVTVNGQRVKEQGIRIDPQKDVIKLNGKNIKQPKLLYYLLNKPKGFVSTTDDEFGREDVLSLIPTKERVYPVGRLDKDTTGLLIITNDGELTNLLTHPKYHVDKVYRVTIEGRILRPQFERLERGVKLDDGMTAPAKVTLLDKTKTTTNLEITIHEGRNRQVRRMCGTVGLTLLKLTRIGIGSLTIDTLKERKYRELTTSEVAELKQTAKKAYLKQLGSTIVLH